MPLLSEEQFGLLVALIPKPSRNSKRGRPPASTESSLRAALWILDNGAKWKDLPRDIAPKSTAHRWFQRWARDGVLAHMMEFIATELEKHGEVGLEECFLDGSFVRAKGGGDQIGKTKCGKGQKLMLMVDANGLPIAARTARANPAEVTLVQMLLDFMATKEAPQRIVADKAYDSDRLDEQLAANGIRLIAPNRANRKRTQDQRPLRRYKRRWKVERAFAWLHNFRRLCIRWERYAYLYQAFVHLACAIILSRAFLG